MLVICFSLLLSCSTQGLAQESSSVTVLAFGDVNLGRSVGQKILKGAIDYPFENIRSLLHAADIVFVNLESQLADRGGETQHPKDNFIFCGPPDAARSLKNAGVSVVSTANNHAFDYGFEALVETIDFLRREGIAYVGTSRDSVSLFPAAVLERNGMTIAFIAYTEFVNGNGLWHGRISLFDEKRARKEIGAIRDNVDVVIASYHGGTEYVDSPSRRTLKQMRALVDAGADVVIGHHPHVPQGIEEYAGKLIFYSLGNFVFYQPQHVWTQRAIGVEMTFQKADGVTKVSQARVNPIKAGFQPTALEDESDRLGLLTRIQLLSSVSISTDGNHFIIDRSNLKTWE